MDAIKMLTERRSVRKFKDETVDRELMRSIIDITRYAPSWANTQIARYTLVDDPETLKKLANDGVKGFVYNMKTIERAKGIAVLSFVQGKSGQLADKVPGDESANARLWEAFDCGISCQTFCLAAHEKGVGTCIFGVIDEESISKILDLPAEETVAAMIVYGYIDGETKTPRRLAIDDVVRFI